MSRLYRTKATGLLLLFSITGIAAGYKLMIDPTGHRLGLDATALAHSPLTDYIVPGIVLFTAIGLSSLLTAALLLARPRLAWGLCFYQGLMTVLWVAAQAVLMRAWHPLYWIALMLAVVLLSLGYLLKEERRPRITCRDDLPITKASQHSQAAWQ